MDALDVVLKIFEVVFVASAILAIILMIIAGIWTGLNSKFEDKVEKEVRRRVLNTLRYINFNVHIDVIEDLLGKDEKTQV